MKKLITSQPRKSGLALNKALLMAICLMLVKLVSAQDLILMKDGREIHAKILEIGENEVKYKKEDNPGGPTIISKKSSIFYVKYQNGEKEVFADEPQETKAPVTFVDPLPEAPSSHNPFDPDNSDFAKKKRKNFSGPRVGVTYIGPGTTVDYLNDQGKNPFLVQFGWQFEGRLWTTADGTTGLVEFVPLIGGIEQGLFLPSASFLLGVRSGKNSSFEFAVGPNFALKGDSHGDIAGALGVVFAIGTSFKKDNVWFPVNLAFVPSVGTSEDIQDQNGKVTGKQTFQSGFKVALLVGFNSRTK